MYTNVFYASHINNIGGIETFLYELARLSYKHKRDLTIVYGTADTIQLARLRKYCRIIAYKDIEKPIKCKRALFNYNIDPIDYFEAEEYIQIIHADFKDPSLKDWRLFTSPKITKYYAVSNNNAKSFEELTGTTNIETLYNPINIDDEPRVMTLISAQRLSGEKGGRRLEKMIKALDNEKIPYVWHIFADGRLTIDSPNVMYHKPTLDVRRWLKYADYTVLLSDTEGFPYTAYESLCLGTPLIITRLLMIDELGCTEENSFVIDFDLSNLDVKKIYEKAGKLKFKYEPKENKWLDILTGKSTYHYEAPNLVSIKVTKRYFDTVLDGRLMEVGTVYEVPEERAEKIINMGYAKYI